MQKFVSSIPEAVQLTISAMGGEELLSGLIKIAEYEIDHIDKFIVPIVNSSTQESREDHINLISSLVPSFSNSVDQVKNSITIYQTTQSIISLQTQCTRLDLGKEKFALSWVSGHILAQVMINSIVVSMLLHENANLGLLEGQLQTLTDGLQPICNEIGMAK